MFQTNKFSALCFFVLISLLCDSGIGQTTVFNTNDSGAGSLRSAIVMGGTVDFDPVLFSTPQTITLATPLPMTSINYAINGPGADLLTIEGTFSNGEIFFISGGVVSLSGLTLSGARNGPPADYSSPTVGIFLRGNLTLDSVLLRDFQSQAVFNQVGDLAVINSTITNNGEDGVFNQVGNLAVINSTITNNGEDGVFNQSGTTTIDNSTIVNNGERGVFHNGTGNVAISSSIVANNSAEEDIFSFGSDLTAEFSLIESTSLFTDGVNGNIVGIDPLLIPFGAADGDATSFLLSPGSPAIDAGANLLGLTLDQNGGTRVRGSQIDIGATEFSPVPEPSSLRVIYGLGLAFLARRKKPRYRD